MITPCLDISPFGNFKCDENYQYQPLPDFIRKAIEVHEKVFPDYVFDKLEIEYKDGRYLATPHFKHRAIK